MKIIIILLSLCVSMITMADTIKKWTDKDGVVHYGDPEAAEHIKGTTTLKLEDSFDEQAYQEGVERHKEVKDFGDKMEKEREAEEKQKAEEERLNRPPPALNRTTIINPTLTYGTPYRYPRGGSGIIDLPVQLPADFL